MAKYKLQNSGVIREDGAAIPDCEANTDWREYQAWLAIAGNVPDPQFTLAEAQTNKINELRSKASAAISVAYPIYAQMNINALQGYSQVQKDAMWVTINAARNNCNAKELAVAAATTIAAVAAIVF